MEVEEEAVAAVVEAEFLERRVQKEASVAEIPWVGRLQEVRSVAPLDVAALECTCWIR
jgi:hypothetical protein